MQDFSGYTVNLLAQVAGATVQAYNWNFALAPDAQNISSTSTNQVSFTWATVSH